MKQLKNTPEDRNLLNSMLSEGYPMATFSLGCFTSDLADSLTSNNYTGFVTDIDLDSGYCNWKHETGREMPCVNIDCITIHEK